MDDLVRKTKDIIRRERLITKGQGSRGLLRRD